MARARDLLDRFRPAGAPGAAAAVGVPADRLAEVSEELEPVLALLDEVAQQCTALRAAGEARAARLREEGLQRVAQVQSSGREKARAARAEVAARAQRQVEEDRTRALAEGAREAAAVLRRAGTRRQDLVDRAVAGLRLVPVTSGRAP